MESRLQASEMTLAVQRGDVVSVTVATDMLERVIARMVAELRQL